MPQARDSLFSTPAASASAHSGNRILFEQQYDVDIEEAHRLEQRISDIDPKRFESMGASTLAPRRIKMSAIRDRITWLTERYTNELKQD